MMRIESIPNQKGAALVVVLLLVATLAILMVSITQNTTDAVRRTGANLAREQLYWRHIGAETLALTAIDRALENADTAPLNAEHPLFASPFLLPLEEGSGALRFADATRCFNINALVVGSDDTGFKKNEAAAAEFRRLVESLGLGSTDAEAISDVVVDWIDSDAAQELRGAEDGFYTGLPVPLPDRRRADRVDFRIARHEGGIARILRSDRAFYLRLRQ